MSRNVVVGYSLVLALTLLLTASVRSQQPLYVFAGDDAGDLFGSAVAAAGDVNGDGFGDLIVGAPADDNQGPDSGSARVLSGADGSVLYTFDGDNAGDLLGSSVAGAGDVNGDGFADVIAGAPGDDNNGSDSGSVRVFSGVDGSVLYTFDGDSAGDELGRSASGAGDVDNDGYADVIAGAPGDDNNGSDSGSARVFSGVDGGVLYTFDGDGAGDELGHAVAGAGDFNADCFADLVAGAPFDDDGGMDAGRVFVFSGLDGTSLGVFDGDDAGDNLGHAVSGAGDVNADGSADVIAGAPGDDNNGAESGSARVLSGADGSTIWAFDGDGPGDQLGLSVGGAGDVNGDSFADVIAGVPLHDLGETDVGCARVWSGADGSRIYTYDGDDAADQLGNSVSGAGDVNGDGYADLIVGVPQDDDSGDDAGSAVVFAMPPFDALALEATLTPATSLSGFGVEVSRLGDVNNDGVDDYGVGAPFEFGMLGVVWVFSGADDTQLHLFIGPVPDSFFGTEVGDAGDIDQDGFADIIVGAFHEDPTGQDSGTSRVFSGQTGAVIREYTGLGFRSHMGAAGGTLGDVDGDSVDDLFLGMGLHNNETGKVRVVSGATSAVLYEVDGGGIGDWLGWGADAVGDINGDGITDLAIGAPAPQNERAGYCLVVSGVDGAIIHTLNGTGSIDRFGWEVDGAGDVNGDGVPDIIVGVERYDAPGLVDIGKAQVFSGADGSLLYDLQGTIAGENYGRTVSGAGDINGDGFDDFCVGGPLASPGGVSGAGSAYIYSGIDGTVLARIDGDDAGDGMGSDLDGLGDIDGDGYPDFAVGAATDDTTGIDAGKVEVHESSVLRDPGSTRALGAACPGSNSQLPTLEFGGRPVIGSVFRTTLRAAVPTTGASLLIDAAPQSLPLDIIGAPGCTLVALPLFAIPAATDPAGKASVPLGLPNNPAFVGATLYSQWFVIDPPANRLGAVLSNAGAATIGK